MMNVPQPTLNPTLTERVEQLDWTVAQESLFEHGFAKLGPLLSPAECSYFRARYDDEVLYRSHIHMARYGFGKGEYKYFSYPLPDPLTTIRSASYTPLSMIANHWNERLSRDTRYPDSHDGYIAHCHEKGQKRPTPLILKYGAGDYNCLHQDLYGEEYFPFQMAVMLSKPEEEFTGGEFVLVENRPRMQSRPQVVSLKQGEAIVFAVNERPRLGSRGYHRTTLRHGVSEVTSGTRYMLGVIYHDAT
ncbi:2OG-Fe(II) oxygenase [Kordiimonas sp.]|uniref:2OG-Fe(II) oxygenase n=1 Tax=Kordiimonas sp. TaxID=1970157 RepID=UPI003B51CE9D